MKPRKQIVLDEPESEASELSVAERIKILEKQFSDPNISAKDAAALNKQIAILRHEITPGRYTRVGATTEAVERRKLKKRVEELPDYFLKDRTKWTHVFLLERLVNFHRGIVRCSWGPLIDRELDAYWATLSDSEKQEFRDIAFGTPVAETATIPPVSIVPVTNTNTTVPPVNTFSPDASPVTIDPSLSPDVGPEPYTARDGNTLLID